MKFTAKHFHNIGGSSFLLTGLGHLFYELFLTDAESSSKLRQLMDGFDFRVLGTQVSLYEFYSGYSICMGFQDLFIGLICLSNVEPSRKTLLVLLGGSIVSLCLVIKFFGGGPPLYLNVVGVLSFLIGYSKYTNVKAVPIWKG